MTHFIPSGSRWEPLPGDAAPVPGASQRPERPRRRARPLLVLLLSVLTLGAATGGVALARESGSVVEPGTTRPDVLESGPPDPRTGGVDGERGGRHHGAGGSNQGGHGDGAPAAPNQEPDGAGA